MAEDEQKQELSLAQRVRKLVKDVEGNRTCAECRAKKPSWMSLFTTRPVEGGESSEDTRRFGVFCCSTCSEYLAPLVALHICELKSLKKSDKFTERDVLILENSGNTAVNAVYEAKLQGNHSEKQKGTLASTGFVSMKYHEGIFFCKEAYVKQMEICQWEPLHRKRRASLTTQDLVRKALTRQDTLKNVMTGSSSDLQGSALKRQGTMRNLMTDSASELLGDKRPETRRYKSLGSSKDHPLPVPVDRKPGSSTLASRKSASRRKSERIAIRWNRSLSQINSCMDNSSLRRNESNRTLCTDDHQIEAKLTARIIPSRTVVRRCSATTRDFHQSLSDFRTFTTWTRENSKAIRPRLEERRKPRSSSTRKERSTSTHKSRSTSTHKSRSTSNHKSTPPRRSTSKDRSKVIPDTPKVGNDPPVSFEDSFVLCPDSSPRKNGSSSDFVRYPNSSSRNHGGSSSDLGGSGSKLALFFEQSSHLDTEDMPCGTDDSVCDSDMVAVNSTSTEFQVRSNKKATSPTTALLGCLDPVNGDADDAVLLTPFSRVALTS